MQYRSAHHILRERNSLHHYGYHQCNGFFKIKKLHLRRYEFERNSFLNDAKNVCS